MTTQAHQGENLAVEKFEAEVREVEARLKVLGARAEARKAKEDMDQISGLTAAKDRVRQEITELKRKVAADSATTKYAVQQKVNALKADLDRLGERYAAWDEASERRFNARLDEAEARLATWKARADRKRAEEGMKRHDALAKLEEEIALARAGAAAARRERYSAKAQAALEETALRFDQAYDAAAKRYENQ